MALNKKVRGSIKGQVVDSKDDTTNTTTNRLVEGIGDCECYSTSWYYNNRFFRGMYDNSKWFYCLNFRVQDLPKRCVNGYDVLMDMFIDYSKPNYKRFSKRGATKVVNCFVKNVSRMRYHKTLSLRYSRGKGSWCKNNNVFNVSSKLSLELIDMLVDMKLLNSYTGLYGGKLHGNISSMLVITQELLDICTGKAEEIPMLMENCLKHRKGHYMFIREKNDKGVQVERNPVRGEIMRAKELEKDLLVYNDELENHTITINDELVQDLYFRAMFNNDLDHGGRLCDQGQIQSKSKKERSTIRIDGSQTISLDFKSLHPSFLFELEHISLYGRDPYACDLHIPVDHDKVYDWVEEHNLFDVYETKSDYKPKRNLAKTALLCMINADSEQSAISATCKALRDDWKRKDKSTRKFVGLENPVKVKDLVQELKENNKEISHYFFKGFGTRCMNLESQIMMYCVKSFILEDRMLLPMHDAIIIKEVDEHFGMEILFEGYGMVMNGLLNCRIEKE